MARMTDFAQPRVGGARPSRRSLIRGAAAAAATIAAAPALRARPLQDRLKLAAVGAANRGAANIAGVLAEDLAFLCDVDSNLLAKGVAQVEAGGGPAPKGYADWRVLLDEQGDDLDGIVISTPDHTHFAIARAALRKGIPVYCEKPLTHTVAEARELLRLAREAGVPTQMGTQIHATENYRRVVEALRAGAIGDVHRVDIACTTSWSDGRWGEPAEPPAHLDWDLWQGPAVARDYVADIHPANWRRYWRYGMGTVGDMATHWVDLAHWALGLTTPSVVEARGPEVHEVGAPAWLEARWLHAETEDRGAVEVRWFDGGRKPEFCPLPNCHVFHGTKGKLVSTYSSMDVQLDDAEATFEAPERSIAPSPGHHREWLNAIKDSGAPAPLCEFEYAAPLTETVLLAAVAYRAGAGEPIALNSEGGDTEAWSKFLSTETREGWDV